MGFALAEGEISSLMANYSQDYLGSYRSMPGLPELQPALQDPPLSDWTWLSREAFQVPIHGLISRLIDRDVNIK
ncbi:predicted protein [Chaetomium globosum CBS 148.51]|uniref:Uncharacterized protein n=1 Tax=Chaetomium globosum (strain ATCC 6205 / CBS 148.51 / DSM 1962 / NBRC 6347 / NRRL 1970) TaxID=306901 RepID=Q2HFE4_CHAGB|nr:uncharacterized protein CHGG_01060 [Chaetomium globosum CBS 148.51]EAQ92825.1 predicted protein [Chaetomium globosum CBS 148.51]